MVLMLMEIKRWLQQPKERKLVCFISSIVGLICYACSSSFNRLFGKWTLWKISLCIAFSFSIVYLVHRFATKTVHFSSPGMKAHSAFSVLLITSVYSFFVDKKVVGKSDVYSLVSSAAFATTSLGLSTDFLYFFSGLLIVQLMKINFWLVIVGGGFSYFLIILRPTLDPQLPISNRPEDQAPLLPPDPQLPISHIPEDHAPLLQPPFSPQVPGASGSVSLPNSPQHTDATSVTTQVASSSPQGNIINRGLIRTQFMEHIEELKKENRKVINTIFKHVGEYLKANVVNEDHIPVPEIQADDNLVADALPQGIITKLGETGRMMSQNECYNAYSRCRSEFLKDCLSVFGLQVEEFKVEDIDMMKKVESWIKALNLTVRILFPNERRLCDLVFSSSHAADISFSKVCKDLTIGLLRFVNSLATENHHSPYHLSHVIPKVFKTLSGLIPNFDSLFFGQLLSEPLRNDAVLVGKRLGIFVELESLIQHGVAQETVPNGGIHPTTHKVMDYLRDVFTDNENFSIRKGMSSFSDQVARIILVLHSNLEAKSTNYKDPALGHVFMLNNLMLLQYGEHIYGVIFGEDWYKSKINQNIELYQRSSWNKILEFLMPDSFESMAPNVVAGLMKNKLKLFNQHFNDICRAQSAWFIFDEELREQMKKSIEKTLLPAYGNFIGKLQDVIGKDAYDFIEYGLQNIQDLLSLLFLESNA